MTSSPGPRPPRVLSGIQPTGSGFHLGNYLGALRRWVGMQEGFEAFYFIPDLHAITVPHDPAALRRRTFETVAELLAVGVDPARSTLFVQSQVHEHAELAWVLGCITGFGEASRMTQFKDKSARQELGAASVGLFTYPVLQAADILLYQADLVPVGDDQRQHLELTRDLAQRFNSRFGVTFTVPGAHAQRPADRILDLQDPSRKMSKSLPPAGTIYLKDDPAAIRKKIRAAVTDPGREVRADPANKPGVTNLLTIFAEVTGRSVAELEIEYAGRGYGDFKRDLADALVATLEPVQHRLRELTWSPAYVDEVLATGRARAAATAGETMYAVRRAVGLLTPIE